MTTIKFDAVAVVVQQERETLDVTAVALSGGNAFAESRATKAVQLINLTGTTPIEYRVGSGAWLPLTESASVDLDIDLSATTLRVRRSGRIDIPARAQIFFELKTVEANATDPSATLDGMQIVISTEAPNDSDGRPDGTLWIQIA